MDNIVTRVSFVSEVEYNKVFNENVQLKLKIIELYKNEELLKETINNNKLNIEELVAENIMLKNKINELENKLIYILEENKQIKEENKQIKEENKILNYKINTLEKEVSKLNNTIDKINDKAYISKVIYALQDLNTIELLEKFLKIPFNKLMCKMRNNRNDECHYILNEDDYDIILCKEKALYDILKSLDDSKRQLLNKKVNSSLLVDEIITFLKSKSYTSINEEDYEYYISWFED
jgi:chromosome segregation ATPase